MTIVVITVADVLNPVELQSWIDVHSSDIISRILNVNGIFYIFYE